MKKLLLFVVLGSSLSSAFSKDVETGYVGYFWKEAEKPIIYPVVFLDKEDCEKELKSANENTQKTVKITRNYLCQPVMILSKDKKSNKK